MRPTRGPAPRRGHRGHRGRVRAAGRARQGVGATWFLAVAVLVLGGLLLGRLVQWQVLDPSGPIGPQSGWTTTREVSTPAMRGRILAADGTPLVVNTPQTVLTLDPSVLIESPDQGRAVIEDLAAELGLPVEQLWGRTRVCGTRGAPAPPRCLSGSPYQAVPIAEGIDPAAALAVLERTAQFPGVGVAATPVREHVADTVGAAQLVGYLGPATATEVATDGLSAQDLAGRAGLEAAHDDRLRGTPGTRTLAVDPRGVVVEEVERTDPRPGLDLLTHLDPTVQGTAQRVLGEAVAAARGDGRPASSAAAVVMDVRTGAVIASASHPTYDPDIWTGGVSVDQFEELTDPAGGQPLLDRTIGATFPPASTFKAISLPAALRAGVDPEASYPCPSSLIVAGQRFRNFESRAYGEIDVQQAIEVSCDTIFYRWAYDTWVDLGGLAQDSDLTDPFLLLAREFGLGALTGVDLPGEVPGLVPSREWRRTTWEATRADVCEQARTGYPEEQDAGRRAYLERSAQESCVDGWQYRPGDAVNLAIGQGDLSTTPLQLTVAYAAIANGGTRWTPQVAAGYATGDGVVVERVVPRVAGRVALRPAELKVVRDGLAGVNVRGTGAAAFEGFDLAGYPVAGKTGSAESLGRRSTAWYASYGPTTAPRYAVVVVVEQGGLGGEVAAPAARKIWDVLRDRPAGGPSGLGQ